MEQLLTIGEFAQRCGLSRSALRFYDQNDLLRPQLVDEETGYRYYAIGQLEQAGVVARLRAAEMPIGVVREFLEADPAQRIEMLEAHAVSFRERASAVDAVVDELRRGIDPEDGRAGAGACSVAATELAGGLQQVRFAVGDPAVRRELGAVWIETKEASLRLVATDSYRLAVRDLVPQRVGPAALRGVIDAERVAELIGRLARARTVMLCQDSLGVIEAVIDHEPIKVGHAGEGFPDYERILSELPSGEQIALPRSAVRAALDRLAPDSELRLGLQTERLTLQAGEREESIAGRWSGKALRIGVDARFFREAVEATVGPDIVIEAVDTLQPITLRAADSGIFSVLTMPIRLPEQA